MLESTPGKPYSGLEGMADVEQNMRARRARLLSALRPGEAAASWLYFSRACMHTHTHNWTRIRIMV